MFQRVAALVLMLCTVLLQAACATAPSPQPAVFPVPDAVSSPEWAADMQRFAAEDLLAPPPRHPVVFTGSSSIRLWDTLAADFLTGRY